MQPCGRAAPLGAARQLRSGLTRIPAHGCANRRTRYAILAPASKQCADALPAASHILPLPACLHFRRETLSSSSNRRAQPCTEVQGPMRTAACTARLPQLEAPVHRPAAQPCDAAGGAVQLGHGCSNAGCECVAHVCNTPACCTARRLLGFELTVFPYTQLRG